MKQFIEKKLKELKGLSLKYFGRSSNLFWFGIGEIIKVRQGKQHFKEVATYHLNVQSMWRLIEGKKILVASMDVYSPRTDEEEDETFEWEIQDSNLFDEKVQNLTKILKNNVYISVIKASEIGDIKLTFSNGWILEVYVDSSNNTECWRMLKSGKLDSHMIVTGMGLEE